MEIQPIGIIHSPFVRPEGMPIQPTGARGVKGQVIINEPFQEGLKDLSDFSHIILLYHFHQSKGYELHVKPFMDETERGVFATRAPKRPNAIGLSVVKLIEIENGILHIENVDMLDGSPLLDIKPYVPEFDSHTDCRTGWLEQARKDVFNHKADKRFKF